MNLLLVAVFFGSVSMVLSLEKEKVREIARQLLVECQNQEGASNEDLEKIVQEELPGTVEGNCMMACAYELVEIVSGVSTNNSSSHFIILTVH